MTDVCDWQSIEDRLFEESKKAIFQCMAEHPDALFTCFGYDTDPMYGYFLLSIDTYDHALLRAKQDEQHAIDLRKQAFSHEQSWRSAKRVTASSSIPDFPSETQFFTYFMYKQVMFSEIDEMRVRDAYPKGEEYEDNYIEGNVCIILWKVVERLIASQVFAQMKLASPFRIGYAIHDEAFVTLRILNWPQV